MKLNEDLSGHQVSFMKPTIIMDRGIATKDNIKHLKENHYSYIIIERGDIASQYINEFQNARETFEKLETTKKSSYGDFNNVYIKKIEHTDTSCRVLCGIFSLAYIWPVINRERSLARSLSKAFQSS